MKANTFTAGTYKAENARGEKVELAAMKVEYEDVDPTESAVHIYARVNSISVLISTDPDDEKFKAEE
jgi:hypothetical protein